MASIDLVVSAFLLVAFVAALISTRLKIPYTLILVSIGVSITVIAIIIVTPIKLSSSTYAESD